MPAGVSLRLYPRPRYAYFIFTLLIMDDIDFVILATTVITAAYRFVPLFAPMCTPLSFLVLTASAIVTTKDIEVSRKSPADKSPLADQPSEAVGSLLDYIPAPGFE